MRWDVVWTVVAKELRETLRDRRTIIIMLVIPVFLYPGIFILMQQLALFGQKQIEAEAPRVAIVGEAPHRADLAGGRELRLASAADPVGALRRGELEAVVVFPDHAGADTNTTPVRVYYDASRPPSEAAWRLVRARLQRIDAMILKERLVQRGLPASFGDPLEVTAESVATPARVGASALGRFLPLILVMMTILGAFHAAVDLAAGEKERRTLEPLLTTAVSAGDLVTGKFLAASVVALAVATLNLGSMLLTLQTGLFQVAAVADVDFKVPLEAIVFVLVALLLLAILFSSLFLGIAVRAQSFKEAQNSLTPVYVVGLLPGLVATLPGVGFTVPVALVPVAGVAMLLRSLLTGEVALLPSAVAIASTILYAAATVAFAARSFGREDVLFGSGTGEIRNASVWERLRARRVLRLPPTPVEALAFVAAVGLIFFYFGLRLSVLGEPGLFAAQWLLLGLPAILVVTLGPFAPRATLALRRPRVVVLVAAMLIIVGGIPVGWAIGWLQSLIFDIPEEFMRAMEQLLSAGDPGRIWWLLLLVAFTPAICEELVFRGVLLQGLRSGLKWQYALLASAAMFGAFHLSLETVIRFLPTAWTGLLLGFVVLRSGSIVPAMLMHFVNNGIAILLVSSPVVRSTVLSDTSTPKWWIMLLGPLALSVGAWLLFRHTETPDQPPPKAQLTGSLRADAAASAL